MEKTIKNVKNRQKIILILIGGAVGVVLLLFGGASESKSSEAVAVEENVYSMTEKYAEDLEARVAEICSGVRGVSNVEVFVSLSGGYRTVYAYDSQSSSSGHKSELVMSGSGSDKSAVVSAYEYPEIAGVGIVCHGADDPAVRAQLISLVSAALNVSTNRIYVANAQGS